MVGIPSQTPLLPYPFADLARESRLVTSGNTQRLGELAPAFRHRIPVPFPGAKPTSVTLSPHANDSDQALRSFGRIC